MTTFLREIDTLLLYIGTLTARNTPDLEDVLRESKLNSARKDVFRDYCLRFRSSDWTDLNNHGITVQKVRLVGEKLKEFKKNFPFTIDSDEDTPQIGLAAIYYKYFSSKPRAACDELRTFINDDYQGDYKDLKFLSEHEWVFKGQAVVSLPILNPYSEVPRIISDIETFLDNIKEITDFNLSKFRYDQQFKILRTFVDDIQNSNIEANQKDILLFNWAKVFLRSIFLFHIQMKIPTKEIMALMNHPCRHDLVEDQYDEALNTNFVLSMSGFLFDKGDVDSDEINQIYHQHEGDEINNVLKPFVEDFLPYFQNLFSTKEIMKLTINMDSRLETFSIYQHFSRSMYEGLKKDQKRKSGLSARGYVHLLPTCYLDLLPFKLRDPPNESFNKLLKVCIHGINNSQYDYYAQQLPPRNKQHYFSFELDEIEDNLDTLQLQKYYICYYIVNYVRAQPLSVDQLPLALVMSLLPWYIDDESEDARTLENMLMENVHKQIGDLTGSSYCWTWYDYITKVVWPATEPLNVQDLKNKINPKLNPKEEPKEDLFSGLPEGCCNIF